MRRSILLVLSLLFFACLEQSVTYSPDADDRAMASLTRAWAQAGGDARIALCEDLAVSALPDDPNTCQIENIVRGGGRGTSHSESRGGGCGGCPFDNVAYVKGTVSGGGLAAPARVTGFVYVGGGHGDDPYGYPYTLVLSCDDAAAPCSVNGTLEADGSLHLTVERGADGAIGNPSATADLTPTGASSCPM